MMEIAGGATSAMPPHSAELGYVNVSNSNRYSLSVLVDPEVQLQELSTANNRLELDWFTLAPSAYAKTAAERGRDGPGIVVHERKIEHSYVAQSARLLGTPPFYTFAPSPDLYSLKIMAVPAERRAFPLPTIITISYDSGR